MTLQDTLQEYLVTIERPNRKEKINPIIRRATPEDVGRIISTYLDVYEGTYPYKEMEDETSVLDMIKSDDVEFLVFESFTGAMLGCVTFVLDFKKKMGYLRGLMVAPKFRGRVNIVKATVASLIAMYSKYDGNIFRWYSESRTAHAKSQHAICAGSLGPIAFYPNKDVFHGKVESDLLLISYDEKALTTRRSSKVPTFIPEVKGCFDFSNARYYLGDHEICSKELDLDHDEISRLKKGLRRCLILEEFGYAKVVLSIDGSRSIFSFLYTSTVQNFEKTKYKVNSPEELHVYVEEFKKCIMEFGVRYAEVFASAYKPEHQKIFKNSGFEPRGYVPSWKYNEKNRRLEDCVVFNYFEGAIDPEIQLLRECKSLVNCLGFSL